MKALLQRVSHAEIRVAGKVVGEISAGALVMVGCEAQDEALTSVKMAEKILGFRMFEDENGKTNLNVTEANGALLVVSQFTLVADTRKGRRPSFDGALAPAEASARVSELCDCLRQAGGIVAEGQFGAKMEVELVNQGPATYLLEL
jgi:D-tyrosyl-tRNA(Tyr) deacylase